MLPALFFIPGKAHQVFECFSNLLGHEAIRGKSSRLEPVRDFFPGFLGLVLRQLEFPGYLLHLESKNTRCRQDFHIQRAIGRHFTKPPLRLVLFHEPIENSALFLRIVEGLASPPDGY